MYTQRSKTSNFCKRVFLLALSVMFVSQYFSFFTTFFSVPVARAYNSVTVNAYTTSGDGSIRYWNNTSFSSAKSASAGRNISETGVNTGTVSEGSIGWNDSTNWLISRTFLPFDTSAIPTNAIIDSATLHLKGTKYVSGGFVSLVSSHQASPNFLTDQDFSLIDFTKQAEDINTNIFGGSLNCFAPLSGDWIITSSCVLSGTVIAPASVIVNSGAVVTISPNSKLLLDFKHFKLLVKKGGGVLIKKTAVLRQVKAGDVNAPPIINQALNAVHTMQSWPLNTTGVSNIVKGGVTEFAIVTQNDFNNTEPQTGGLNNFGLANIATSRAPQEDRPYLEITYHVPDPAPVLVPQFQNFGGSALYNQPYQNLSFPIPVNGQYFMHTGDDMHSSISVRRGMNIYSMSFDTAGYAKMLKMIQDIGLSPTASYPLYDSGQPSEVATKVRAAGLPINPNLSQGTFTISPNTNTYLRDLGQKAFSEITGIDPSEISPVYNMADLPGAGFTNLGADVTFFRPPLISKNSLNVIQDVSGNFTLINNEKATAQQITESAANTLVQFGITEDFIAGNFDDNFAQSLGLVLLSGIDPNAQIYATYGNANEVITRTISPENPYASDLTSNLTGSISKAPSLAQNLAAAGATPSQISALVAAAPTANQAAQAILDASKGKGQSALQGSNYILTPQQLSNITGVPFAPPAVPPILPPIGDPSTTSDLSILRPGALLMLLISNKPVYGCYEIPCQVASTDWTGLGTEVLGLPIFTESSLYWSASITNYGTDIFSTFGTAHTTPEAVRHGILNQIAAQPRVTQISFPKVNYALTLATSSWVTQFDKKLQEDYKSNDPGDPSKELAYDEYCLIASGVTAGYQMSKTIDGVVFPVTASSIRMASLTSSGKWIPSTTALQGIQAINNSLANGKSIIVGVNGTSKPGNTLTEHWVVIVSASVDSNGKQNYRFYDTGANSAVNGTAENALLQVDPNNLLLTGPRPYVGQSQETYTVTEVRPRP